MKAALTLLLLTLSTSAFAQGAAPFWEPLPGPGGAPTVNNIFLLDSSVGTTLGGTLYKFDPNAGKWVAIGNSESSQTINPIGSAPHYGSLWTHIPTELYASYDDTVYFSNNNGKTWRTLGSFGHQGILAPIQNIFETPSGYAFIFNDSNTLFISADTFHTINTVHPPEFAYQITNIADTLYEQTTSARIYRSTDFGKDWTLFLDMDDSFRNWVNINFFPGIWIASGSHLSQKFPYNFSDYALSYSFDRGKAWTPMTIPDTNRGSEISVAGVDNDLRIFLTHAGADDSNFRSDDTGKTWHAILMDPSWISSDGTLYAPGGTTGNATAYFFSTDHGDTWDTVSTAGLACIPFSMISFHGAAWLCTTDELLSSHDDGATWQIYDNLQWFQTGDLSVRPDSGWLMLNTTEWVPGQNWLCNGVYAWAYGIGMVTSNLHLWLSQVYGGPLTESLDMGCNYDTVPKSVSATSILHILETMKDTILTVSASTIMKGYEAASPFVNAQPERGVLPAVTPTGGVAKDSTGAIYIPMSDGKLFVTKDGANTWQSFPSPATDSIAPVMHMAATPNGLLFAIDSNRVTGFTTTWEYNPAKQAWSNVTSGLRRAGFSDTAQVTNIWYVNGYAYAGTWNMGLFRSFNAVDAAAGVETAEHHSPFSLYPNPASSFVTMTYPSFVSGTYRIIDMAGRELARGTIAPNSGKTTLDVRGFPDGLYEVTVGGGGWVPAKLVVNH